jgi:hypothetical protein
LKRGSEKARRRGNNKKVLKISRLAKTGSEVKSTIKLGKSMSNSQAGCKERKRRRQKKKFDRTKKEAVQCKTAGRA